ncbi:MAG: hypothetical protein OXD01_03530 [Gammaproteobacteria bacterium]|nr:hypothetical protein [Gammaproteobacteria bacterium]
MMPSMRQISIDLTLALAVVHIRASHLEKMRSLVGAIPYADTG